MKISERIAKLIDLKSILSLAVIGALIYLAVVDKIPSEAFIAIASSIVTYYFTRKNTE
jgi:hypothetical protein